MEYILASASPRRQELLKFIKTDFTVLPADIEENVPPTIEAEFSPEFLSVQKARFVAESHPDSLVIGSDTGVFLDGVMLGKPESEKDAAEMLSSLSGRTHSVITGCALFYKGKSFSFSEKTLVTFLPLSTAEIAEYIASGSPFDKAGGYGIQDKGCLFVKSIEGDYSSVVGLPVARLKREIENFLNMFGEADE